MSYHALDVDLNGYEMFESPARRGSSRKKKRFERLAAKEITPANISLVLKKIEPKTKNQEKVFDDYSKGKHIVTLGCAGSGKSFLSVYLALNEILNTKSSKKKLVIIRSAVPGRDQGFLPGSAAEKMKIYENPYVSICKNLFGRSDAYEILKKRGIIEFESTSYMRGETFDDSILLFDEVQNANYQEIHTILTRLGNNSKLFIAGDYGQDDLNKSKYDVSGLGQIMKILNKMREVSTTYFTLDDIQRSGFVKNFYRALYAGQNDIDTKLPAFLAVETA